jgi:hypothetical protein
LEEGRMTEEPGRRIELAGSRLRCEVDARRPPMASRTGTSRVQYLSVDRWDEDDEFWQGVSQKTDLKNST